MLPRQTALERAIVRPTSGELMQRQVELLTMVWFWAALVAVAAALLLVFRPLRSSVAQRDPAEFNPLQRADIASPRAAFVGDPAGRALSAANVPFGRLAEPWELEDVVRFFATTQALFLTGAIMSSRVDGPPRRCGRSRIDHCKLLTCATAVPAWSWRHGSAPWHVARGRL